ncbi:GntP family permease [Peribacillus aracenensis]|uniref:GntP family permease n=1 Tax=Peribacillus aracenensis TaxID=2976708 RepID=UPI0021A721B9|nr:GntP family permease [Peribacillus sp. BBB004]
MSSSTLILLFVLAIFVLLYLVMVKKMQPFLVLLIVSVLLGLFAGVDPIKVVESVQKGMGETLAQISIIIGLGAMFGEILNVSGGAERIASTLIDKFGEKRLNWAFVLSGFLVGIPVFFTVGFVVLIPLLYSVVRRTNKPILYFGLPLLSGLAVTQSFFPPHPGPVSTIAILGADTGWVILFGFLTGLPAAIVAGVFYGRFISKKIPVLLPENVEIPKFDNNKELPGFWLIICLVLLPLVLMLSGTFADLFFAEGSGGYVALQFLGSPIIVLTIAVLLTLYVLGKKRGFSNTDLQSITTKAFEPIGGILLIIGAGGIFKQILIDTGTSKIIGDVMSDFGGGSLIITAFLISAAIRVALGSATVTMVTTSSLMLPAIQQIDLSQPMLALIVVTIASGATVLSHFNDGAFWMVGKYFGLTEKQTLMSWTVTETIIGCVGFVLCFIISFFV